MSRDATTDEPPGLLQRVAAGDGAAVDELLARYRPLVWSIVRGRVPHDAAEDVVQEVFIQLWKSAERFDPALASEATFVGMIARRRLVDRQRRDDARPSAELLPEDLPQDELPQDAVELRDEAEWAERALERIRPEERAVLRMSLSGLSHREIARRTDTPLGTVKSQARRGLERVRRLLEEEGA
ncbi:MAG: sigma-70 family RNA polymerase sigma factor [Planctomycetes bacterium]|nr:sigma-70 family RNA polymerase sigma factor [Planctomycetota bacterium]